MSCGKFLMFGDSITQFAFNTQMIEGDDKHYFAIGPALCNAYTRKLDIVQRGYSGYNSTWALKMLPSILEKESNIMMAYVFFGSNDAVLAGPPYVSTTDYQSNIKNIVKLMKSKGIKVIVVGPGLVDTQKCEELRGDTPDYCVRTLESFKKYSDAAASVAKEENVPFVDLFTSFEKEGGQNWKELLCDGLHYAGSGYEIFFDQLLKKIKEAYPSYHPDNIEIQFPEWRAVCAKPELLDK